MVRPTSVEGPSATTPTFRYPYLTGPGKSPSWNGARIAAYWLAGTPPRNTSVSVPRLMPEWTVCTRISSGPGSGSRTGRISPWPGRRSQKARASRVIGLLLAPFSGRTAPPQFAYHQRDASDTYGGSVRAVRSGPVIGLTGHAAVLAAVAWTVGLGVAGALVGAACALVGC